LSARVAITASLFTISTSELTSISEAVTIPGPFLEIFLEKDPSE